MFQSRLIVLKSVKTRLFWTILSHITIKWILVASLSYNNKQPQSCISKFLEYCNLCYLPTPSEEKGADDCSHIIVLSKCGGMHIRSAVKNSSQLYMRKGDLYKVKKGHYYFLCGSVRLSIGNGPDAAVSTLQK